MASLSLGPQPHQHNPPSDHQYHHHHAPPPAAAAHMDADKVPCLYIHLHGDFLVLCCRILFPTWKSSWVPLGLPWSSWEASVFARSLLLMLWRGLEVVAAGIFVEFLGDLGVCTVLLAFLLLARFWSFQPDFGDVFFSCFNFWAKWFCEYFNYDFFFSFLQFLGFFTTSSILWIFSPVEVPYLFVRFNIYLSFLFQNSLIFLSFYLCYIYVQRFYKYGYSFPAIVRSATFYMAHFYVNMIFL